MPFPLQLQTILFHKQSIEVFVPDAYAVKKAYEEGMIVDQERQDTKGTYLYTYFRGWTLKLRNGGMKGLGRLKYLPLISTRASPCYISLYMVQRYIVSKIIATMLAAVHQTLKDRSRRYSLHRPTLTPILRK